MVSGTIIGESIRFGASLDGVVLTVNQIQRGGPARLSAEQEAVGIPPALDVDRVEVDDADAALLANALAEVLDDVGWYVDFRSADETFVVFAGCVFRYRRGEKSGRAEAEEYARARGVPEGQLDWPE